MRLPNAAFPWAFTGEEVLREPEKVDFEQAKSPRAPKSHRPQGLILILRT